MINTYACIPELETGENMTELQNDSHLDHFGVLTIFMAVFTSNSIKYFLFHVGMKRERIEDYIIECFKTVLFCHVL